MALTEIIRPDDKQYYKMKNSYGITGYKKPGTKKVLDSRCHGNDRNKERLYEISDRQTGENDRCEI